MYFIPSKYLILNYEILIIKIYVYKIISISSIFYKLPIHILVACILRQQNSVSSLSHKPSEIPNPGSVY